MKDFMPVYGNTEAEEDAGPDPELLKSKVMSMFMRMGGKVKRGDTR